MNVDQFARGWPRTRLPQESSVESPSQSWFSGRKSIVSSGEVAEHLSMTDKGIYITLPLFIGPTGNETIDLLQNWRFENGQAGTVGIRLLRQDVSVSYTTHRTVSNSEVWHRGI